MVSFDVNIEKGDKSNIFNDSYITSCSGMPDLRWLSDRTLFPALPISAGINDVHYKFYNISISCSLYFAKPRKVYLFGVAIEGNFINFAEGSS